MSANSANTATAKSGNHLDLTLDTDRAQRIGCPEIVYGAGKDDEHLLAAVGGLVNAHGYAFATRCTPSGRKVLRKVYPKMQESERCGGCLIGLIPEISAGPVAVVTAGSSDAAVADEAMMTLAARGVEGRRFGDVGVAGLQRLLKRLPEISECVAVVAIAGMDAALPTVLGGLVSIPIIAVPTSVGYGATEGGLTAMHSLLSSCAPGLVVVNVDNGFSAAYHAASIAHQLARAQQ